jgi:DNA-binding transcriptional MerR regulator
MNTRKSCKNKEKRSLGCTYGSWGRSALIDETGVSDMSVALDKVYFPFETTLSQPLRQVQSSEIGIGDMARLFGTTLRTLRFYEARGLLKPRRDGQHRYYDAEEQHRFRLIDEGRKLGFTLSEIAGMLDQSRSAGGLKLTLASILSQIEYLENQRRDIDAAIANLRQRYYVMSEPETVC